MLRNLLGNAATFSPAGTRIELRAALREGRVRIVVADHGFGIHPDDVARTFEKSGRGRDRCGRKVAGMGLGLYLSRRIVQAHGGELSMDSTSRIAAVFAFDLRGGVVIRVLLVDDHASFRQPLAFMLERELDITVVGQAGTLAEVRGLLQGVDIAVVDLALPDGHGVQLIKELHDASPHSQALVLTGRGDAVQYARAVEAGAAGVLQKSVGIGDIVDAVRRLHAGEALLCRGGLALAPGDDRHAPSGDPAAVARP